MLRIAQGGPAVTVRTERHDHVLVVQIDRAEKRNAIDDETTAGLDEAFNRLDDDADLWVGILTGTPEVFSAGTDLRNGGSPMTERGGEYGLIRRQAHGPAHRGGRGLRAGRRVRAGAGVRPRRGVTHCDVRSARDASRRRRIVRGPAARGARPAAQDRPRAAHQRRDAGGRACPSTGARQSGRRAGRGAGSGPHACRRDLPVVACSPCGRRSRRSTPSSQTVTPPAGRRRPGRSTPSSRLDDMAEGVSAFFEKRTPRWTGR